MIDDPIPGSRVGRRFPHSLALLWATLAAVPAAAQTPAPAQPPTPAPTAPAVPAPTPPVAVPSQPGALRVPGATEDQGPVRTLTIDEAVQLALRLNPTLEQATAAIRRAEGAVQEAKSFERPRLDANGNVTAQAPIPAFNFTVASPTPGQPPMTEHIVLEHHIQKTLTVTGSYNPDPFGRLRASTRAAQREVKAAKGGFYTTQNELVYAVQSVYVAAERAAALVTVAQESVADAQEQLRFAQARNRAGTAPDFDVLRAQVQVENQSQLLIAAQAVATRTYANLARLLAIDPLERLQLAPIALPEASDQAAINTARQALQPAPSVASGSLPDNLQAALDEAFNQRPEIYRAEWTRRAAEARVEYERKGRLPTVTTATNYFYTPDVAGFAKVRNQWSLVANIAAPIWDAGLSRARTKQARADVTSAAAQLVELRDQVAEEVKDALTNFEEANERRRSTAANVAQAREALRIANVRYQAGLATNVEVTDAQLALNQARTNQVNADNDFITALANLNRSLGRYATAALAALRSTPGG